MAERSRRRRRRGNGALSVAIIIAFMLLAAIVGLSVFFKISSISVEGAGIYTADDVVAASGIEVGDSIFFVGQSTAALRIKNALPYVDEVRVQRRLPDTVVIEVTESYPIAYIRSGDDVWIIDKNAKLLEKAGESGAAGKIEVRGVVPIEPTVGGALALGDANALQLTYLKSVLSAFLTDGLRDGVTWLDMTSISDIRFDYQGRFTVKLGNGENLSDKLWMMGKVIADRQDSDQGTVDVSVENEGHFIPG